jgi:hypothetical protein
LIVTAKFLSSLMLSALLIEVMHSSETSVLTAFFIVTAVKTSDSFLTKKLCVSCDVRTRFLYPRRRHSS